MPGASLCWGTSARLTLGSAWSSSLLATRTEKCSTKLFNQ